MARGIVNPPVMPDPPLGRSLKKKMTEKSMSKPTGKRDDLIAGYKAALKMNAAKKGK